MNKLTLDLIEHVKSVVVGDESVGKTSLLISYTSNSFPHDHDVTVIDTYSANKKLEDGETIQLDLWDTGTQEEYASLRPLSYRDCNVFLLCFGIDNRDSFNSITNKWIPEIREALIDTNEKEPMFILIGLKIDLREQLASEFELKYPNLARAAIENVKKSTIKTVASPAPAVLRARSKSYSTETEMKTQLDNSNSSLKSEATPKKKDNSKNSDNSAKKKNNNSNEKNGKNGKNGKNANAKNSGKTKNGSKNKNKLEPKRKQSGARKYHSDTLAMTKTKNNSAKKGNAGTAKNKTAKKGGNKKTNNNNSDTLAKTKRKNSANAGNSTNSKRKNSTTNSNRKNSDNIKSGTNSKRKNSVNSANSAKSKNQTKSKTATKAKTNTAGKKTGTKTGTKNGKNNSKKAGANKPIIGLTASNSSIVADDGDDMKKRPMTPSERTKMTLEKNKKAKKGNNSKKKGGGKGKKGKKKATAKKQKQLPPYISVSEGETLAQITEGIACYIECSALHHNNINETFDVVIDVALLKLPNLKQRLKATPIDAEVNTQSQCCKIL